MDRQFNRMSAKWENYGNKNDWDTMCATCHTTGYRLTAYDPANPKAQKSEWSELNIGCESCHGPGVVFIVTHNIIFLLAAAIIGVISPSGNEIGPFLSVEQAALTQLLPNEKRTQIFTWYNLVGSFATAMGALSGGWLAQLLRSRGMPALDAYRAVLMGYALGGLILVILFLTLSRDVEVAAASKTESGRRVLGLHRSRNVVIRLSALFALDAFAGG